MRLESERLRFDWDPCTGLGEMEDKRTGTRWRQAYPIPPEKAPVMRAALHDGALWETEGFSRDGDGGLNAQPGAAAWEVRMKRNFPIPGLGIQPGDYRVELTADFPGDAAVSGAVAYYTTVQNLSDGFFLAERSLSFRREGDVWITDLPAADMPSCTDAYLLTLRLTGLQTGGKIRGLVLRHMHSGPVVCIGAAVQDEEGITLELRPPQPEAAEQPPVRCRITLLEDTLTYSFQGDAAAPFRGRLVYPPVFHTGEERLSWVLPKDAGLLVPSMELDNEIQYKVPLGEFYVVPGLNMAMIGGSRGKDADGYMLLADTPLCCKVGYTQGDVGTGAAFLPQLQFFGDKGLWAEDRQVRFRFLEKGGYVDMAKAYREIAREKGYLVTYREKAERDSTFALSIGTHRIDSGLDIRELLPLCEKLTEAGISNVLVKFTASRDNVAYIPGERLRETGILQEYQEKYSHIPLYEYENTRDLYVTEGEFALNPQYVDIAEPYKAVAVNGEYTKGWVDNTGNAAYILCPRFARQYVDYRMRRYPLEDYPYAARLFDIFATTNLSEGECYDGAHPWSRLETAELRKDCMRYTREKYRLDVHTEGTAEYYVPLCNTFEGSLAVMNYPGVDHQGEKVDLDVRCRIPFWELVFHDCAATYFHWEHGGLSHPSRAYDDAMVMLYGERGMFLPGFWDNAFETGLIDEMIERIRKLNLVLDRVKTDRMEDHCFLTEDGRVQRTVFSSGVSVTANLDRHTPYEVDGETLEPWSVRVYGPEGRIL